MTRRLFASLLFLLTFAAALPAADSAKAENVVVVTLDGFRWQDFFEGADETLVDDKLGGAKDGPGLKKRYWRDTTAARREALMPFFWGTIAKQGQIFGNSTRKSLATSTNGLKFSYPGYSELFCGVADPRINSNGKRENPNLSVFEYLNKRPGFQGKVEVVGTWDVFDSIFRTQTSGVPVHVGWKPIKAEKLTDREKTLNEAMEMLPRYWPDNAYDVFTFGAAHSAIERRKPRVLYIALGETDEWAHGRRYDLYLDAAHKADKFLAEFWADLQRDPQYKDKTALLITTDHGRGKTRVDWTDHGKGVTGAEFIWMAAMGVGVPAAGEREGVLTTQNQIAATVASLVGEDFLTASPEAAKPLAFAVTTATTGVKMPEIIGHRGASFDAPENTVAAMKLAWEQNADASELDTYLTKDGKAVVIHDATTKRVAGVDLKVADHTLAELHALDVGKWKGEKFTGEKLPTLEEMLATVAPGKKVYVEVKCGPEIVPELDRLLKASGLKPEQTPVIAFNANVIAAVKKARPDVPAYWLASLKPAKGKQPPTAEELIEKAKSVNADGLDLSGEESLDATFAKKVKDAGLKLYVWTVNDAAVAKRLAPYVEGITTDRPAWLRNQLK
ncbi:glycerophosphodiester phosphodiesterase family protein [Limnoglobus roseus]|uniref:Glycerophosphodiester phosphodiesterase n=1 Tax=Limnoglobus roseus TaxID=2598579 RepID=A0A5C1ACF1_9BACT|nr:glycerophosphodiester phosphodiesterase family protein [Limnoglobus roseus]QEL15817.1 glycerophosphodiester phosphodiesterase [Limnoglobus roseus]